jgi:glutamate N-acetyltransferase/amino-acid N-acetyltransferase
MTLRGQVRGTLRGGGGVHEKQGVRRAHHCDRKNLENGTAQVIVCNSGNANTCNADGVYIAEKMCEFTGAALGVSPSDVIIGSTGVIGQPLPLEPVERGIRELGPKLTKDGAHEAQIAIMTTDLKPKEVSIQFDVDGAMVTVGAMAKGSGMIRPNMATMLSFITTDCAIAAPMLKKALTLVVDDTYNMVSVGRGHLHQRHGVRHGQRPCGKPCDRSRRRGL